MALTEGSRLGPYVIQSAISGEAGEVYAARDTRVDRAVVIKVLPDGDPDRRQRFESQAKILAALNHPNIRTLHDIGREPRPAEGDAQQVEREPDSGTAPKADELEIQFLVLEHLEGETVADRLARAAGSSASKKKQPFRAHEALAVAMQIADALDKAHQKGLIHGDLKPSTVFLTRGSKSSDPPIAKLLALGFVESGGSGSSGPANRLRQGSSGGQEVGLHIQHSMLPTREQATAATVSSVEYLAPEQIEGRPADARTDIFALGVVLYEMLTGRKAFEGKSPSALTAAIMTAEPDPLSAAQPLAPPALDHVLKRCLAKDPEDRWQTAHDLLIQLRWIAGRDATSGPAAGKERKQQWLIRAAVAAAVVMIAALATPIARYLRGPGEQEPFQFRSPVVGLVTSEISISPDGRMLAFMATPNSQQPASLYVRPIGGLDSRRLNGTDDAEQPFWSPDSRFIGFVAGGKLKKVEAVGGPTQEIADALGFSGGTWNEAGTIVFGSPKGLFSVPAEGGKPAAPLTTIEKQETGHLWPRFLPDGRHYVYQAWSNQSTNRALFIGSLDSKDRTRLVAAETNVAYTSGSGRTTGYLVFHREATLFAQPFDAEHLAFAGDAVQIASPVGYDPMNGRGYFEVSQDAVLVYFQSGGRGRGGVGRGVLRPLGGSPQLGWVSRTGQPLDTVGDPAPVPQGDFDVSRDGNLVAVAREEPDGGADIWVLDAQRAGIPTRLTLDPGDDINPIWSSDGSRVAFTSYRKGNADIYVKNANGLGEDIPVLESAGNEIVESWSRDGRYIAYLSGQGDFLDIYVLPQFGEKKPFPVVQGRYRKDEPQISYDGKWMAYTSEESGTFEVYVVTFPPQNPATDQKLKVSIGGGQPRWREDGKELYYRALDGAIMVVNIASGPKLSAGIPQHLFTPAQRGNQVIDPTRHQLAASPDGQRFLMRVTPGQARGRGAPAAGFTIDPATGQVGGRGQGRGQGFAAGNAGLTVIRNWSAAWR